MPKNLIYLLCVATFIFTTCQKEDYSVNDIDSNKSILSIETISYQQLGSKQKSFLREFNKKQKAVKIGYLNRSSEESGETILIDTTSATHIRYQDYNSYTFSVETDISQPLLKNVLMSEMTNGNTQYFLFEYILDMPLYQIEEEDLENHIVQSSVTEISLSNISFFGNQSLRSSDCYDFVEYTIYVCRDAANNVIESIGEPHDNCYSMPTTRVVRTITFDMDCGTPPGGGDYSIPDDGGGDNGDDPGNYDGAGPIVGDPNDDNDNGSNDDCDEALAAGFVDANGNCVVGITNPTKSSGGTSQKKRYLKSIVENPTISAKLNQLAPKVNSDQSSNYREDGARFKIMSNGSYEQRNPSVRKGSSLDYEPDYESNETISVHIHQTETWKYRDDGTPSDETFPNAPIYSEGDVYEFLENLNFIDDNDPLLAESVTSLLMAEKPDSDDEVNLFAMVVNNNIDKEDALNAFAALQDDDVYDKFNEDFREDVLKEWINGNCDNACVVESFIAFINNYTINGEPLGISIYLYTNDNGTINWIKL